MFVDVIANCSCQRRRLVSRNQVYRVKRIVYLIRAGSDGGEHEWQRRSDVLSVPNGPWRAERLGFETKPPQLLFHTSSVISCWNANECSILTFRFQLNGTASDLLVDEQNKERLFRCGR